MSIPKLFPYIEFRTEDRTYLVKEREKKPLRVEEYDAQGLLLGCTTYPDMATALAACIPTHPSSENIFDDCQTRLHAILSKKARYPVAAQENLKEALKALEEKKGEEAFAKLFLSLSKDPDLQAVLQVTDEISKKNNKPVSPDLPLLQLLEKLEIVKNNLKQPQNEEVNKKLEEARLALTRIFFGDKSFFKRILFPLFLLSSDKEEKAQKLGLQIASLFQNEREYVIAIYSQLVKNFPTWWQGYYLLAEQYENPQEKNHQLLRGACSALQVKALDQAREFCEKSLDDTFVNQLAFLQVKADQGDQALLRKEITRYAKSYSSRQLVQPNENRSTSITATHQVRQLKEQIKITNLLLRFNLESLEVYSSLRDAHLQLCKIDCSHAPQKAIFWSLRMMEALHQAGRHKEAEAICQELQEVTRIALSTTSEKYHVEHVQKVIIPPSDVVKAAVVWQVVTSLEEALQTTGPLDEIDLSKNSTKIEPLQLWKALKKHPNLKVLNLENQRITEELCKVFFLEETTSTWLQKLYLSLDRMIDDVAPTAKLLKHLTTLPSLCLEIQNENEEEELSALTEALRNMPSLRHLTLRFGDVPSKDMKVIFEVLQSLTHLQTFDFLVHELDDEDEDDCLVRESSTSLVAAINHLTSLEVLNLGPNLINWMDAAPLAEGFKNFTSLRILNLSFNYIGDEGLAQLLENAKHLNSVQELNLYGTGFGSQSVAALAEMNPSWQVLNVGSNSIGDKGIATLAETIRRAISLQEANFSSCDIGDFGAAILVDCLKNLPSLKRFYFGNNSIARTNSTEFAQELRQLTSLEELYLEAKNKPQDEEILKIVQALSSLRSLRKLSLGHYWLEEKTIVALAESLKKLTLLQELNLKKCFGRGGIGNLPESFRFLTALQELNLSFAWIQPKDVIRLLENLKDLSTLRTLNLQYNAIGSVNKKRFTDELGGVTTIFSDDQKITAGQQLEEALLCDTPLTEFTLSENSLTEEDNSLFLQVLKKHPRMQKLDLTSTCMSLATLMEGTKNLSCLQELNLSKCYIDYNAAISLLEIVKRLPSLQTIQISKNRIGPHGAVLLKERCNTFKLEGLDDQGNQWNGTTYELYSPELLDDILQTETAISNLDLSASSWGLDYVKLKQVCERNPSLQSLKIDFQYTNLTRLKASIDQLTSLKTLHLTADTNRVIAVCYGSPPFAVTHEEKIDITIADILRGISSLEELQLNYPLGRTNNVPDFGALVEVLSNLRQLKKISLSYSNLAVDEDQIKAFANSIQNLSGLHTLELRGVKVNETGLQYLVEKLKNISSLHTLAFEQCAISTKEAKILSSGLQNLPALTTLSLKENVIGPYGSELLKQELKQVPTLSLGEQRALTLTNQLDDLLEAKTTPSELNLNGEMNSVLQTKLNAILKKHTSIQKLELYLSKLDHASLAEGLESATSLKCLWISGSDSNEPEKYPDFFETLKKLTSLEYFGFIGRTLKGATLTSLLEALKCLTAVETLDLRYNEIDDEGATLLLNELKSIDSIKTIHLSNNNISEEGKKAIEKIVFAIPNKGFFAFGNKLQVFF